MGLIKPGGPRWAYATNNLGTLSVSPLASGTNVTLGTSNADGSAVTLLSALAHDVEFLRIGIGNVGSAGINSSALLDILIDPAGGTSWTEYVPDLLAGYTAAAGPAGGPAYWYELPVWVPAGASLGAYGRTQGTGALTAQVWVQAYGGNANPASWWCGQRVANWGVSPSTSRGTVVTAPANNTWGSWTNIGSTLDAACGALAIGVQGPGSSIASGVASYWQAGVSSQSIAPTVLKYVSSTEDGWATPIGPWFVNLAAGTQLQMRWLHSNASSQSYDCALYTVH